MNAPSKVVIAGGSGALGLTGRHATSRVLRDAGFRFRYLTFDQAVRDLLPG